MPRFKIMGNCYYAIVMIFILLQLHDSCTAMPLCTDSTAPFTPKRQLQFCPYNNGTSCCDYMDDLRLKQQFQSMNISDPACASVVKSILCTRCDQFSAELYRVKSSSVPVLCNSTVSPNSTQSNQATSNFCTQVWDTCQSISISNSPFATSSSKPQRNSNVTKLTDIFPSKSDFCNSLGASSEDGLVCFAGEPVTLNDTVTPNPPSGMCLEKLGNGSYLNMAPHPDGSNRAFFANQQGKIWLATLPEPDSGDILQLDESNPFLDLTDEVYFDTEFGMLGLAFHPNFLQNGRFFVSFNCDKAKWPNCAGRCACNSDVNCDPAKLSPDNGAQPCQYNSVIAEYTVNGTASNPSSATRANPLEVRRIFTMGLPFTLHHGGQILFGPEDGYLYFMMGDGGGVGDPFNFAQNKKSLLGKIMRFDIDNMPSGTDITQLNLWGNYSIPNDNPYTIDKDLEKEIWALGFRNPWRCSFDSSRPSYFICSDVGQDAYEEVDLITKNGNYGWRVYEGPYLYNPPKSPAVNNTPSSSIRPIFPVMGYNHSDINTNEGSASITGGYIYRSLSDPCMYGRYLYADLYAGSIWAGVENPINSGNFTSAKIPFTCAQDSPLSCTYATPNSSVPALSYIFSFGEDNKRDVYLLTNSGLYRIVRPSRCNYACAKDNGPGSTSRSPSPPRSRGDMLLRGPCEIFLAMISVLCLVLINFM